jgi:hypothetical protein
MPRIIRLDKKTISEIEKVKKYAAEHIFDENTLLAIKEKILPPQNSNKNLIVNIHQDFKVVYSLDTIDGIVYHHLSISYKNGEGCAGIPEVIIILKTFGLSEDIKNLDSVWLDESKNIVNLLKKI